MTKQYIDENYIETHTGKKFHFLEPDPSEIDIMDIAWSLSLQCRYNGHVKRFYSVAEHCCHIYDYMFHVMGVGNWPMVDKTHGDMLLRTALLHDASEAYLSDIARPIKNMLPDYKKLEANIEKIIATKYQTLFPLPGSVKELDTRILFDERQQLLGSSGNVWAIDNTDLKPLDVIIHGWPPVDAYENFMKRLREHV